MNGETAKHFDAQPRSVIDTLVLMCLCVVFVYMASGVLRIEEPYNHKQIMLFFSRHPHMLKTWCDHPAASSRDKPCNAFSGSWKTPTKKSACAC